MQKKSLIVGCNGSMGKRYQAIMANLKQDCFLADIGTKESDLGFFIEKSDNIIIATPTNTHLGILLKAARSGKNILCEKPISKDMYELAQIFDHIDDSKCKFTMTMQYKELVDDSTIGTSEYNYFRSGTDGLAWDCIQIIGLAKGKLVLKNTSPIWRCKINGKRLNLGDMDSAYVNFVKKFLEKKESDDLDYLWSIHEKTAILANAGQNIYEQ